MSEFKPTKEDLEKLAKVADIDLAHSNLLSIFNKKGGGLFEPHESRDDISLILEGLTDEQRISYNSKMGQAVWIPEHKDGFTYNFGVWMQTVHPSVSCEQLLKVLEAK